jgi:hypothetical protein
MSQWITAAEAMHRARQEAEEAAILGYQYEESLIQKRAEIILNASRSIDQARDEAAKQWNAATMATTGFLTRIVCIAQARSHEEQARNHEEVLAGTRDNLSMLKQKQETAAAATTIATGVARGLAQGALLFVATGAAQYRASLGYNLDRYMKIHNIEVDQLMAELDIDAQDYARLRQRPRPDKAGATYDLEVGQVAVWCSCNSWVLRRILQETEVELLTS